MGCEIIYCYQLIKHVVAWIHIATYSGTIQSPELSKLAMIYSVGYLAMKLGTHEQYELIFIFAKIFKQPFLYVNNKRANFVFYLLIVFYSYLIYHWFI